MEDGGNQGRLILVSGATGEEGGVVARSLLGRGFGVRSPGAVHNGTIGA
jgi:hypothetical protein